jgi:hypothetical protein
MVELMRATSAFDAQHLADWLLGRAVPPSNSTLRAAQVAAYAYTVLPDDHPQRANLRIDYVNALGRHQRLKDQLLPLLSAWRDERLEVLLFKGFQLSEFVYPRPGARFHGDIDVLLHPEHLTRAESVARELGWHTARPASGWLGYNHNAFCLAREGARIDVHRDILHASLPWHSTQRRITEAVWERAGARWWNWVDIREPSPVDMLLVGLVLQRCWSAEDWNIKPHDVLDFRYIVSRFDVTRDALWNRAHTLRCERTLAAFLERCDPDEDRLDLTPVTAPEGRRLRRRAFRERGLLGPSELFVSRVLRSPFALLFALRFLPAVLRVRAALGRHLDMHSLLESLNAKGRNRPSALPREYVIAGVHWATRLIGTGRYGPCLVRALSAFVALRRHGWPVDFVTGVRRNTPVVVGHAWVEYDGGVLLEMEQPDVCAKFEPNFRFRSSVIARSGPGRGPVAPTPSATREKEHVAQTHHG